MAFPWTGKKDVPPGAKPEFPAGLEIDDPESPAASPPDKPAAASQADRPLAVSQPAHPLAASQAAESLLTLTDRLERLGAAVEEARQQVTSYLVHRDSQAKAEPARGLARQLDALTDKLERLAGGRGADQKLDAIYGKLDQLTAMAEAAPAGPAADGGPAAASLEPVLKTAIRPLAEKLDQLEAKLKLVEALKEAFASNLVKIRDALSEQHGTFGAGLRQLTEIVPQYFNALPQYFTVIQQQVAAAQTHVDAGLRTIVDILRPPENEAQPGVSGDWPTAVLGPELAQKPALDAQRRQLLRGVLGGEPAASALVGCLMIFRSSPAERMPPLLKEIGEAYYRWQPRTTNRPGELETALADWLQRTCEQAGVSNSIELVHPGERFDSTRHNASKPGVEITQVLGWIVLRDNGRVYTKASVAVK